MLELRREELDSSVAQGLIAALNAELEAVYPEEGANHFELEPSETVRGRGVFLVGYEAGQPIACGALRMIEGGDAELKRMFVTASGRGRGVGRIVLAALEEAARRLGARRVVLEAGARQGAALGLYEGAGYVRIAAFGGYVASPLSLCLGKELG